jgi:hypothetical protein
MEDAAIGWAKAPSVYGWTHCAYGEAVAGRQVVVAVAVDLGRGIGVIVVHDHFGCSSACCSTAERQRTYDKEDFLSHRSILLQLQAILKKRGSEESSRIRDAVSVRTSCTNKSGVTGGRLALCSAD